jgi:catechol 2,3-dioxygenase-like lactoylglutathione lyase family enzyme
MIDHTGLSVTDFDAAKKFYDAALAPLGVKLLMMVPPEYAGGVKAGGYGKTKPEFWLSEGQKQTPPIHIAFRAESRAEVDAFHEAAIAAGGKDNDAPGLRPHYHADYYGAFVLDPDGHNIEAVCHKPAAG